MAAGAIGEAARQGRAGEMPVEGAKSEHKLPALQRRQRIEGPMRLAGQQSPEAQRGVGVGDNATIECSSGALNRPRRNAGGTTASTASSFSLGSMRR